MELPYLKNKNKNKNQGGGGPVEMTRDPDEDSDQNILGMVADEMLDSYHKGDHEAFLHALRAFVLMIQHEDKEQDAAS